MSTPRARRPAAALVLGTVLGALTWAAWLGWDRTASFDVVTGTIQKPYVTLQVLGCALTVGLGTAVLAARGHPAGAALGVTLGFWLVWTLHARAHDATGLYAVGSGMLAIGLTAGTTVAAVLGAAARTAVARRHAAGDASGEREVR